MKIRRALRKWNQRKDITKKMRAICAHGILKKNHINLRAVFNAMKREYLIDKRMSIQTNQLFTFLLNKQRQMAFDTIRKYVKEKTGT